MRILGDRPERKFLKLDVLQSLLKETGSVANQIASGNIDFAMSENFLKSELADSFLALKGNLTNIREEESRRSWLNNGIVQMNELVRNAQSLSLSELLDKSLSKLVRMVDAFQGSMVTISNDAAEKSLVVAASFAVDRALQKHRRIQIGDGLLGQCVLEKAPVYLTDLPAGFFKISSGLGEAKPTTLLIVPMAYKEECVGAIELGFFQKLAQHQLEFVNKVSEIIAAVILNDLERERMRQIISLTQRQADELKAKEDEISRIREEEKLLLESKLDTQRRSYEMIIEKLKAKLQAISETSK